MRYLKICLYMIILTLLCLCVIVSYINADI